MVIALTVVIAIVAVFIIQSSINRLIFRHKGAQDEIHYARTDDGYEVALYRYRPDHITPGREPVIMCHGLGGNRYTWDPGPLPSFAKYLNKNGYDVWLLDLRGRGLSARPDRKRGGRLKWGWTFDDYVKYDLPGAITHVLKETGSKQANWVGHSMGGMVMYAYLQTQDASLIRSVTALGSPAAFGGMKIWRRLANRTPAIFWRQRKIAMKSFGAFAAPWGFILPVARFGVPRNLYPWFAVIGVDDVSIEEIRQFHHWVTNKTFHNADHSYSYDEGLSKINTPFMAISGGGDLIAPWRDVKYGVDNMSSADKKFVLFSKKNGSRENYDHMSMVVSESATLEVWPVILDWLAKHRDA